MIIGSRACPRRLGGRRGRVSGGRHRHRAGRAAGGGADGGSR